MFVALLLAALAQSQSLDQYKTPSSKQLVIALPTTLHTVVLVLNMLSKTVSVYETTNVI